MSSRLEALRNRAKVPATEAPRFEFKNKTANSAEILLYGTIGEDWMGEGITGKSFAKELRALGAVRSIDLRIDSPGGSVFDARTIYTLLTEHKAEINVYVDGLAASAASFIAMAGDKIHVSEGGFFMIHEARGMTRGTASDHEKNAVLLKAVSDTIAQTYVARTGQAKATVLAWMAEEKWFEGKEAVKYKFADEIMANKKVTACAFPGEFKNLPAALRPNAVRARQIKARMGLTNVS